jgi:hypothetical protein
MIRNYLQQCSASSHCSHVAVARAMLLPICCQNAHRVGFNVRSRSADPANPTGGTETGPRAGKDSPTPPLGREKPGKAGGWVAVVLESKSGT